jgi:sporulation protein YqfD
MDAFQSFSGLVMVCVTTADQIGFLQKIRESGLTLKDVRIMDDFTIVFDCKRADYRKIRNVVKARGDQVSLLEKKGIFWTILGLRSRPIFVIGLTLLFILSMIVPRRVLFVQVEGNENIPTNLILETASRCGITMGRKTRSVRSEDLKNMLISELPQLEWVGINTYGCVAKISVKERDAKPEEGRNWGISSIYAKSDGIILSATARKGSLLCKPGDAVVTGQKLISGLTDCGICIRGTAAEGDILALTNRQLTAISPVFYNARGENTFLQRKYALLIGKKRINFYKGSGILDTTCAKINSVWYVTLPGGFVLPIGIIRETYTTCRQGAQRFQDDCFSAYAQSYILSQMAEGEILSFSEQIEEREDALILQGQYVCRESLGISRTEENFEEYGKNP